MGAFGEEIFLVASRYKRLVEPITWSVTSKGTRIYLQSLLTVQEQLEEMRWIEKEHLLSSKVGTY